MALQIGDNAPAIELTTLTADGPAIWKLSENIGTKNILLLFVPMAFTGVCTDELCQITESINKYQDLNAEVIAISGDNPFAQAAWSEKEGIKLPMLSDYEHNVTKAYGVAYDSFLPEKNLTMGGVAKRSAFIIDKNGTIQHTEILESPGDLPNFEAIQAKLAELS